MRALALAHRWVPRHNAGAEVMLHSMLRALAARGHDVTVLLTRQTGESYDLDGVHIAPISDPAVLGDAVAAADVVITHLENTPAATLRGRWQHVPVVQVLHNTMDITKDWAALGPALVVCNSQWMLADLAETLGNRMPPAIVCRPPVSAVDYATTPGDRVTLINLRPMEASPGGAVMGKGSELFWALARRRSETPFLAVRGAYGAQDIRWLPNVDLIGHVAHDQMRDLVYARTRVLLAPSSYESWGRVAVEAMCSGIPVIAHPTPGLVEALGGAGILCDRDDIDAWSAALDQLADPAAYAEASQRALQRAADLDPAADLARWCEAVESLRR